MKEIAIRIEDKVNKLLLIFFLDPPLIVPDAANLAQVEFKPNSPRSRFRHCAATRSKPLMTTTVHLAKQALSV